MHNILITSVGRRSYIVRWFKQALCGEGKVYAGNSTDITPSFTQADGVIVTPPIYSDNYISVVLDFCKEKRIDIVISLFDIDLLILAKNKKKFEENNINLIVSSEDVILRCNDKWNTYLFCKRNNLNTPFSSIDMEEIICAIRNGTAKYPLIVKPRWGMGSIGCFEVNNEEELIFFSKYCSNKIYNSYLKYESNRTPESLLIFQEKIKGEEYGLDIINDLEGRYINTVVKKKISMRAGETDCAQIILDGEKKSFGEKISALNGHIANMDLDIISNDGNNYIIDMNARIGGGYPFSHIAGIDLPKSIIRWVENKSADDLLLNEQELLAHKDIDIVKIQ